jgi:predicted HicB family RNase H-like nuclease
MFEIRKEEKITKTFRIPQSLLEQLEKIAQKEGVSVNNLVVQCCEYALNDFGKGNKYVAEK